MKKNILCFLFAMSSFAVFATTYKWIGGSTGDWAVAENWSPAGIPQSKYDTVTFTNSVTFAPAPDFCGIFSVPANITVKASYTAPARFSTAVVAGGRFEKHGNGAVIIHAENGNYYGGIAVMEGSASFAGNGVLNAPGVFGKLEVASGAEARIIESPYATRHSVITYGIFDSRAEATRLADYNSYDKMQAKWNIFATNPTAYKRNQTYAGASQYFPNAPAARFLPNELYAGTNKNYAAVSKCILTMPQKALFSWYASDGYGSSYYYIGSTARNATGYQTIKHINTQDGLLPFTVAAACDAKAHILLEFYPGNLLPNSKIECRLSDNVLWNDVCFRGLSLAENAKFTIAEDCAVAFSFDEDPQIDGKVIAEGTNSYFSIMSSYRPVDVASLTGFAGVLELGLYGEISTSAACKDEKYRVVGYGKIIDTKFDMLPTLDSTFKGTIVVPEGETFTSTTNIPNIAGFIGKGTVIVEEGAPKPSIDFMGNIKYAYPTTYSFTGSEPANQNSISVESGSTFTYGISALSQYGYRLELPSFAKWTMAGSATTNLDASVATLTSDANQSSRLYFPNYAANRLDTWEVKFRYHAKPVAETDVNFGDGFAFLLRSGWSSQPLIRNNTIVSEAGCFGFGLIYGNGINQGFQWFARGIVGARPGASFTVLNDIDFLKPIDFTVKYARGIMNVVLTQGDVSHCFRCDFNYSYTTSDMKPRYLGFAASTYMVASGRLKQEISNLSGFYIQPNSVAPAIEKNEFALTNTNNWELFQKSVWTNDNTSINFVDTTTYNTMGRAICKVPISVYQPFTLSYKFIMGGISGTAYTFSTITTTLQNLGLAAGDMASSGNTALGEGRYTDGNFLPNIANSVSSYFMPYYKSSACILGYRTAPKSKYSEASQAMNKATTTHTYNYKLVYDGSGALSASCAYLSKVASSSRTFAELSKENIGTNFYLMLTGFNGRYTGQGWAKVVRVEDLSLVFLKNHNPKFDASLNFNGDGTLSVASIGDPALEIAATFEDVTLTDGASVRVASATANPTRVEMGVSLNEKGTLTTSGDDVVVLNRITQKGTKPATLTLQGKFEISKDGLTVVIPSTCSTKRGFVLLDTLQATFTSDFDASKVRFVDENGNPVKRFYARIVDGAFYAWYAGPSMFMIQ